MTQPPIGHRTLFQTHLASKSPNTRRIYETTLQRLETWAQRNELDLVQMETADLERFLAEEGRRYSSATIQVRRAALRAFYGSLEDAGMIELDPAYKLRLALIDHLASTGPVAYLTDEAVAGLREHALRLGPISSLAICMLHETPASVRRIASLSITNFAQDGKGQTYAILGRSTATNVPWPISRQILNAAEALRSEHPRLISPLTKNPNVLLVKDAIEQTRLSAGIQTPNLPDALKHAHRRRVQALGAQMRLESRSLLRYQRTLLRDMRPLDASR
jgi:Phage integrase, N-terminal SAM-like domain